MDAFSKMMDKVVRDGIMSGVSVGSMDNSLQLTPRSLSRIEFEYVEYIIFFHSN